MARKNVSDATLRNWQRLNSDVENKLQHRANKSCSCKRIFPLEYIQSKDTLCFVEEILFLVKKRGVSRYDIIYSLAVKLLERNGLAGTRRAGMVLAEFSGKFLPELPVLPADETDILGLVYQCLLLEGEKNKTGSYYTPAHITAEMLSDFDVSEGKTFFDPCCGSGAFLLAAKVESP
ncbi:MAG: SAM-dependent DNA methyltransferase, partial [Lentisphaeria bacterium]|nr:SAM-dependent DNA methyltransferase [Lentisphaeria bacterium]